MKSLLFIIALTTLFSFTIFDPITDQERADLLSYRNASKTLLLSEVKGLSDAQLNWKPNDSAWSIANCVEHITLTEKAIFEWAMGTLKEPADSTKKQEVQLTNEQIKSMIENREQKAKAPEQLKPGGQLGDYKKTIGIYSQQTIDLEKYIKTTKDDLHNHFAKTPVGTVDTYQLLIFLTAHSKRHTAQIIELKAMPNFPN